MEQAYTGFGYILLKFEPDSSKEERKKIAETVVKVGNGNIQTVEFPRDWIFYNSKRKAVYAFNIGIDYSSGPYFIILGAHSLVAIDFIEKSVTTYLEIYKQHHNLAGVGGIIINENENKFNSITTLLYTSALSGARSCRYNLTPHYSDSIIFGLFNKKIVVENGKFDEDFISAGDDDELTTRLVKRGYIFYTNPEIRSHYFPRSSFKGFIVQTYNYGVAKGLLVRKGNLGINIKTPSTFWFFPLLFILYELFIILYFSIVNDNKYFYYYPFILYWIIITIISLNIIIKNKKNSFYILLIPIFFIFHTVISISMLVGLLFGKKGFINK
jgi:GT2 family glycosyltransferase